MKAVHADSPDWINETLGSLLQPEELSSLKRWQQQPPKKENKLYVTADYWAGNPAQDHLVIVVHVSQVKDKRYIAAKSRTEVTN